MLVAGLRNNPDEMEGMRRGQPWQAQPWRATPARATLPAPWRNNRVLWQGACGSFIEKDDEALQARREDQVVLGGPSLRRCTSRRHGAGVGGGATLKGEGAGKTLAGTTLTRATLAGQTWWATLAGANLSP